MNVEFIDEDPGVVETPPRRPRRASGAVDLVRRRPVVSFCAGVALLGLLVVAVTSWRPGSHDVASSPFCTSARRAATLEPTGLQIDEGDPAAVHQAWDAYLTEVDDATAQAPSSIHDDYVREAAMLRSFAETLERHGYDTGAAVSDTDFLATLDDPRIESSRIAVDSYLATKCGA